MMKQLRVDMTSLKEARKKFLKLGDEIEKADLNQTDRVNLTHTFFKLGSFLADALPEWRDLDAK